MRGRHRRSVLGRLRDAGSLVLVLVGLVFVALPHVKQAAGEWRQHEAAVSQDRSILAYRNALAGAYEVIFDPFEDPVVAFQDGARPRPPRLDAGSGPDPGPPAVEMGSTLGQVRVRIPKIDLDQAVVEGVSASALQRGPGHYPGTALPGQPGNMVISGHRTTYSRPFYYLDRLGPGDPIYLDTPDRTYVYVVSRTLVVALDNLRPLGPSSDSELTLTTCNPPGSAIQRLVVQARLVA